MSGERLQTGLDGYANFLREKDLGLAKHQPYLVRWVREFLHFARDHDAHAFEETLDLFLAEVGGLFLVAQVKAHGASAMCLEGLEVADGLGGYERAETVRLSGDGDVSFRFGRDLDGKDVVVAAFVKLSRRVGAHVAAHCS